MRYGRQAALVFLLATASFAIIVAVWGPRVLDTRRDANAIGQFTLTSNGTRMQPEIVLAAGGRAFLSGVSDAGLLVQETGNGRKLRLIDLEGNKRSTIKVPPDLDARTAHYVANDGTIVRDRLSALTNSSPGRPCFRDVFVGGPGREFQRITDTLWKDFEADCASAVSFFNDTFFAITGDGLVQGHLHGGPFLHTPTAVLVDRLRPGPFPGNKALLRTVEVAGLDRNGTPYVVDRVHSFRIVALAGGESVPVLQFNKPDWARGVGNLPGRVAISPIGEVWMTYRRYSAEDSPTGTPFLLRLGVDGQPQEVLRIPPQRRIRALAFDSRGRLYVAAETDRHPCQLPFSCVNWFDFDRTWLLRYDVTQLS